MNEEYIKLIKHLDELINNCNENELYFKKNGFEYSSLSSGSMSVAYNNIKNYILNINNDIILNEKKCINSDAVEFCDFTLDNTIGVIGSRLRLYYVKGLLHGEYTTKQLYEIFKNIQK